jgi:hypothetical protein
MIFMELAQEIADLRPQDFLHQDRLGPDHVDFNIPGTKRRRHFQANEAGADYDRTLCHQSAGDQRATVSQSPKIMHVRESGSGDVETHRLGSGSKQERLIGVAAALREPNLPGRRVDCRYVRAQM